MSIGLWLSRFESYAGSGVRVVEAEDKRGNARVELAPRKEKANGMMLRWMSAVVALYVFLQ